MTIMMDHHWWCDLKKENLPLIRTYRARARVFDFTRVERSTRFPTIKVCRKRNFLKISAGVIILLIIVKTLIIIRQTICVPITLGKTGFSRQLY